jgi:hypothetical protein
MISGSLGHQKPMPYISGDTASLGVFAGSLAALVVLLAVVVWATLRALRHLTASERAENTRFDKPISGLRNSDRPEG